MYIVESIALVGGGDMDWTSDCIGKGEIYRQRGLLITFTFSMAPHHKHCAVLSNGGIRNISPQRMFIESSSPQDTTLVSS